MARHQKFTVSDGKMVLTLTPAKEGGYIVTSPMDPGITTQAETLAEAFANARDAARELRKARATLPVKGLRAAVRPRSRAFATNAVPRPREIKEGLARQICRSLGIPRP